MPMTEYGRNRVLDGVEAPPPTLHLQLHSGPPGVTGTDNVIPLARQPFTRTPAAAGVAANVEALAFPVFASQATVSHWSAWTESVAGVSWWTGQFIESRTYQAADQAIIGEGTLVLRIVPPGA